MINPTNRQLSGLVFALIVVGAIGFAQSIDKNNAWHPASQIDFSAGVPANVLITGSNSQGITLQGDSGSGSPFLTIANPDNSGDSVLTARDGNAFTFEYPAGTRIVTFDDNGNVGIGVANPGAKLDIGTNDAYEVRFTGSMGANIYADSSDLYLLAGSERALRFGSNGINDQIVLSDGNLDIGRNTHIGGALTVDGALTVNGKNVVGIPVCLSTDGLTLVKCNVNACSGYSSCDGTICDPRTSSYTCYGTITSRGSDSCWRTSGTGHDLPGHWGYIICQYENGDSIKVYSDDGCSSSTNYPPNCPTRDSNSCSTAACATGGQVGYLVQA